MAGRRLVPVLVSGRVDFAPCGGRVLVSAHDLVAHAAEADQGGEAGESRGQDERNVRSRGERGKSRR